MATILIVDRDLGFAFWLGKTLVDAGYQALPAKSVRAARELASRFVFDVLVVNPALSGAAGFINNMRQSQGHLRVIGLKDEAKKASEAFGDVQVWASKPKTVDENTGQEWVRLVRGARSARAFQIA